MIPNRGEIDSDDPSRCSTTVDSLVSNAWPEVLADGVRSVDGADGVSLELALDLRLLLPLRTLLMRLAVLCDLEDPSVSLLLDEELLELEVCSMSANTPGCDSSSITCCGVL